MAENDALNGKDKRCSSLRKFCLAIGFIVVVKALTILLEAMTKLMVIEHFRLHLKSSLDNLSACIIQLFSQNTPPAQTPTTSAAMAFDEVLAAAALSQLPPIFGNSSPPKSSTPTAIPTPPEPRGRRSQRASSRQRSPSPRAPLQVSRSPSPSPNTPWHKLPPSKLIG